METKKYKLTEESINPLSSIRLYRIEALKDFADVKKGDKGGFVESRDNLSQYGDCWVYDNATVSGNAEVYGNAKVFGDAMVYGNAAVSDNAQVYGNAAVSDNAQVFGDAEVYGRAQVYGHAKVCHNAKVSSADDYIVFKNWWSSGRYFTWTRSNNMWKVGCFYGTGKELVEKAYKDSELSGREYKRVVDYVNSILKANEYDGIRKNIKERLLSKIRKLFGRWGC